MPTYTQQWIEWSAATFKWNDNPYTWNECFILIEVADEVFNKGGGYTGATEYLKKLPKPKLVRLRAMIDNYPVYDESKDVSDLPSVTVEEVALLVKKMYSITVDVDSFRKT